MPREVSSAMAYMALRSSGTLTGITFSANEGYLIWIRRTMAGQNEEMNGILSAFSRA